MARSSTVHRKVAAAVMAGVLGVTYGSGAAFAQTAKPAKPAAAAPAKPKAPAADAKPDAKKAYTDGEKKFKAGDFSGALADFLVADGIKPTPHAARYIGLCHDNLGHYQDAVAAYERFLADVPPKLGAQGEEVKLRVAAIKAMPGKVHIETVPAGASVAVDGKVLSSVTPTDVDATPGRHTIKLTADGRIPQEKDVDVAYASKQELKAELEAQPPPPAPPPPPEPVAATPPPPPPPPPVTESKGSIVPAIVTGGLAVAALGVGTVFGIMALSDKSDFDKTPTSSKADDGENHALIADMAFGVGITLGVTSLVLLLSNSGSGSSGTAKSTAPALAAKNTSKPLPMSFAPIVTSRGGGAGATFKF